MSVPWRPELERVWLLRGLPEWGEVRRDGWTVAALRIEQGYVPDDADTIARAGLRGRIRHTVLEDGSEDWTHTEKRGMGRVREEAERQIDRGAFDRAWACTGGGRLRKVRWLVSPPASPAPPDAPPDATDQPEGTGCSGQVWEVDQFLDFELVVAEAESAPACAAQLGALEPPAWLAPLVVREVTEDPRYRNSTLARLGPPR